MRLNREQRSTLETQLDIFRNLAQGYHEGAMGEIARTAYDYYYGQLPKPYTKGGSKYVSRDVWESVNGTLQDLLNVFTSGEDAVRFSPMSAGDALSAKAATAYCNKVLLRENDGYAVLSDAIKECLIARNGWVKRYWDERMVEEIQTFNNTPIEELTMMLFGAEDVEVIEQEENEDGTFTGKLKFKTNKSGVKVEYVPFEEVLVDPDARSLEDCNYIGHRTRKTAQELLDMGFKWEDIKKGLYAGGADSYGGELALSRQNGLNPSADGIFSTAGAGDQMTDRVWLFENYIRTSLNKKGKAKLLQVFTLGTNTILEVNEVSEMPFETFTPFPTPAAIYGESVFDITRDIQDLKTALMRGYIDNIMNANYGRYMAVEGQYDRRSLLDNRPGGVVEQKAPGMIDRFPYHMLPSGTDQLLEHVEQAKERRTGVTRMGMGLNADVFKNDNAHATVDMMMSAAQNRMRMVARNIAQNGMTKLFLSIYRLARENETRIIPIEVAGSTVDVRPSEWPERERMEVAVAIGANERRERAQNLSNLLNVLSGNPMVAGSSFQPQNANFIAREITEAMGFYDVNNFVTPFEEIPEPAPSPAEEMQMQGMQLDLQDKQAAVQERMAKIQLEQTKIQLEQAKVQLEQSKLEFEQQKAADDMNIKQLESESRQDELGFKAAQSDAELDIKLEELKLKQRELELKQQELSLEAQLEAIQQRPVGLGNT